MKQLDQLFADTQLPDLISGIPITSDKSAVTVQQGDLVLLEQTLDAARELFDDAVLAPHHLCYINSRRTDRNTLLGEAVSGFLEDVRGVQQGFRRDATNVQTGSAKTRFALWICIGIRFTTGDIETELRGSNGRNIATWTSTDNKNVKLLGHDKFPF